jgi:PleD family two-component response regulator
MVVFVKRIAEAMGGSLKVTSKPGRGSAFVMSVVVADDAPAVRRGSASTPVRSLRVLCVEDNPYGRVVLSTVLRELGHRVTFAGTGEAAIEIVARNEHDVAIKRA